MPPIAFGSHLDTQPTGGKFDGVLGTLAALEALRTLVEAGYETYAPIEVVNWTNEEGSRFAPAMVSSGVFGGAIEKSWAQSRTDRDGMTFAAALDAIGYRGTERCGEHPLSAFFELHIEQGPILEAEGKEIGGVTGVQAMRWYEVTITGQDAHTGATPMHLRKNALLGAARMVDAVDAIGRRHPPGVATVGRIENRPNSPNVVPGEVFFMVDLRHPDGSVLDDMEQGLRRAQFDGVGRSRGAAGDLRPAWADVCRAADLGAARGAVRRGLRGGGPARGGTDRIFCARHRLGRRSRCGVCVPRRAGGDDLRAVPRRHQPQRGGVFLQGAMRQGRAGAVAGGAGL